jgi:surface polysaccharide O-acyltransferase-like enzyme
MKKLGLLYALGILGIYLVNPRLIVDNKWVWALTFLFTLILLVLIYSKDIKHKNN